MMYRLIMAIGVVVVTCFALGCGSSSSEGASASETVSAPLTKAQFIKQADTICAEINKEIQTSFASWKKENSDGGSEANTDRVLKEVVAPLMQSQAEQLEALRAPAVDKAQVARMINTYMKAGDVIARQGQAGLPQLARFAQEASAYGLEECAYPG